VTKFGDNLNNALKNLITPLHYPSLMKNKNIEDRSPEEETRRGANLTT
jgi:hypothetical protein